MCLLCIVFLKYELERRQCAIRILLLKLKWLSDLNLFPNVGVVIVHNKGVPKDQGYIFSLHA